MGEGRCISTQAETRHFHAPVTVALRSETGAQSTVNCAVQSQSGRFGKVIYLSSRSVIKHRLFNHPACILVTLRKEFFFTKEQK